MALEQACEELYAFGQSTTISHPAVADVVGNKGANLMRMAEAGLPVPPGFILPTQLCRDCLQSGGQVPEGTRELLQRGIRQVEQWSGLSFGGDRRPLLVAVRSGSPASMPGMMDTILNVGLCDRTLPALIRMTGNPRHAWDSCRRLIQAYAEVVCRLEPDPFDRILDDYLQRECVPSVSELDVAALKRLVRDFLDHFQTSFGEPFPQDPMAQLFGAVQAVFRSWQSTRAVAYRQLHSLDSLIGTAVTVQTMVFGNMGSTSGSGVGFTRNPATGENGLYLDFLSNAQGEDVVSGRCPVQDVVGLQQRLPELHGQLRRIQERLEFLFRDAQDFEFTVQEGRLYLLQTRNAKRTAWAALRIACEQVTEELIDPAAALSRLAEYDLNSIQQVRVITTEGCRPIGKGIAASPGVAVGKAVFDPNRAVRMAEAGGSAILIRTDSSTADIAGLAASAGVVTTRGGRTSHAAVVARQLNKVCIVGCRELAVSDDCRSGRIGDHVIEDGATVSLDGNSGLVYAGSLEVIIERPTAYLQEVDRWKADVSSAADGG